MTGRDGGRTARTRRAFPLQLTTGNRVLLVEDEILVAMMMRDILTELGFTVIGPFARVSEAMIAAVHDDIDAGIIDVNLGGEFVYPVADVLVARKIPFVFITGYGVESIDGRFGQVPIIKKPVQRQVLQKIFTPASCEEPARFPKGRHGAERDGFGRASSSARQGGDRVASAPPTSPRCTAICHPRCRAGGHARPSGEPGHGNSPNKSIARAWHAPCCFAA